MPERLASVVPAHVLGPARAARPAPDGALRAVPDRDRLLRFLCSPAIVAADGAVASWASAANPGYPYPEAAALWLSWAAWRADRGDAAPAPALVRRVAARLAADLAPAGAIGKGGRLYLFDTCLAVHGLARVAHLPAAREGALRGLDGVARFLAADEPVLPRAPGGRRWSDRWHLQHDRGGALLLQAGRLLGEPRAVALARRLRERLDERALVPAYTHAKLYGLEGELLYRALGEPIGPADPAAAAGRLAALQSPAGALPAWTDRSGGPRSDATAQAVRLWCAVDPARHAAPVARALAWLAARQTPDGGVPYGPPCLDRTSWVAFFVDQAAAWAEDGAEPDRWL